MTERLEGEQPGTQPVAPQRPVLLAYRLGPPELPLVPAARERTWMNATRDRLANRCLPLLLANQAGWVMLNTHALTAVWDGGSSKEALRLEYRSGSPPYPAISHFGHGILTWPIPYLFRTPPGWNLLARGPANHPKDGICALEGLVEADWAVATFTMNWQMTRPGCPIAFEENEPICMLVPQRRGELEAFLPEIWDIAADPVLRAAHEAWARSRAWFLADMAEPGSEAAARGWQKDYFRGVAPGHVHAPEHETKLPLHGFEEPDGS